MGLFDTVRFAIPIEECDIQAGDAFHTKNLRLTMARFTISQDRRLVEHLCRFEESISPDYSPAARRPFLKRIELGEQIVEFHGDIRLYSADDRERPIDVIARFTKGRLEWVRPIAEYPDANLRMLVQIECQRGHLHDMNRRGQPHYRMSKESSAI